MTEVAVARIGEAVDELCDELDRILNAIVQPHAILRLERESAKHWIVVDDRNDVVVMRTPDYGTAVRFAQTWLVRYPGSRLDRSFGLAEGSPARDEFLTGSGEEGTGGLGHSSPAASPDDLFSVSVDRLDVAQVIPIRRGVA